LFGVIFLGSVEPFCLSFVQYNITNAPNPFPEQQGRGLKNFPVSRKKMWNMVSYKRGTFNPPPFVKEGPGVSFIK
ncbi:MAG: hypothetical protein ACT6FF_09305, partial [Methanosarcinaceae archaeon]